MNVYNDFEVNKGTREWKDVSRDLEKTLNRPGAQRIKVDRTFRHFCVLIQMSFKNISPNSFKEYHYCG